jgi:geranylgeranyl pyrophosphate synthase
LPGPIHQSPAVSTAQAIIIVGCHYFLLPSSVQHTARQSFSIIENVANYKLITTENSNMMTASKYAMAASIIATMTVMAPTSHAFAPRQCSSRVISVQSQSHNSLLQMNYVQKEMAPSSSNESASKEIRPQPVVVSAEAEALSHSKTTMKLTPSFGLFQMLPDDEGGHVPFTMAGNELRDSEILKMGIPDTLWGMKLRDYKGLGGEKKIETLPDPFKMVEKELQPFSDSIKELVSTDQPILSMAAKHFFQKRHGKRTRPVIIQLMSKAVAACNPESMNGDNGDSWQYSGASKVDVEGGVVTSTNHMGSDVWRKQGQLGQIVEMIHVASLIHDDVLDEADTRRGGEAVHKLYSNKVAVLAGDYLLARASVLLARLENTAVVQIMATALESLVAGEIMQLKSSPDELLQMESYLRKSYYKTASLICYACRSTALLGGHAYGSTVATACEEFGFHIGLAFQIQDDILDFTAAADILGKPALADMSLGLSTAPILYAAQEFPHLQPLVKRRFKEQGDKQTALEALYKSKTAMDKAKRLAEFHAQKAVDALLRLPQSEARDALLRLTYVVITRKK